jgi:hydroxyethylthiazole kinase-like uncharacterized protein yjeF
VESSRFSNQPSWATSRIYPGPPTTDHRLPITDSYLRFMLKILSMAQIRELDQHTIQHEPVASIDLMERACVAFVRWFSVKFDTARRVVVVSGTGNNGGDGLGIARLLQEAGYPISVWIVRGGKESADFSANLKKLPKKLSPVDFAMGTAFTECDVIIDAVFGSGLSRSAEGIQEEAIRAINGSNAIRVAVDIPSGLLADQHTSGIAVEAHHTISFQLPKLAFVLPENGRYVGEWHRVDIGLSKAFIRDCKTAHYYMTRKSAQRLLKTREKFTHKGDYGRGLIVSGSLGKMGAAVLAARGALRAGIGLLTVHVPGCGNDILQTTAPEAMTSIDPSASVITKAPPADGYDAIGIGPGLGQSAQSAEALRVLLEAGKPMVIDADALNILSASRELLHLVPAGSVLTPHPGEFERLSGKWDNDFDRLARQLTLARQLKSIVLVKGAHTAIATPEGEVIFNCTGNPGMATGGTGDVLCGFLTGLLAQGYSVRDAALLGVYLHGLAGDLASAELGEHSLVAGDIVDFLPRAFLTLG